MFEVQCVWGSICLKFNMFSMLAVQCFEVQYICELICLRVQYV